MARGHILDLTGQRFGRLVVERMQDMRKGRAMWLCQCDCGNMAVVQSGRLTAKRTQSCGCYRRENSAAMQTTHSMTRSPTYLTWVSMLQRCENPKATGYKYYGEKNVVVCPRWHDFELFLEDVGCRPEGRTLDRYPNPAGDYEPGNVRWATPKEQSQNKRLKFDL